MRDDVVIGRPAILACSGAAPGRARRPRPAPTARARPRSARASRRRRRSPSPSAGGSRRGCWWPAAPSGWRRRGRRPPGSSRCRPSARAALDATRPVASVALDELAVDDDEGAVGVAVVVQADGLTRRPAEQPDLVGRRGEQAEAGPLRGVVGDVAPPQRLGGGEAGDDVGEHRHVEGEGRRRVKRWCGHGGLRGGCSGIRREGRSAMATIVHKTRLVQSTISSVWYERR